MCKDPERKKLGESGRIRKISDQAESSLFGPKGELPFILRY
jgi:hypothetical protein